MVQLHLLRRPVGLRVSLYLSHVSVAYQQIRGYNSVRNPSNTP